MKHKYGYFSENQISLHKQLIRKQIFFLLQNVDPRTKQEYKNENINVNLIFTNLLYDISGLNSLLNEPPEIVTVLSLLEEARITYEIKSDYTANEFQESAFRKLVLDAGSEVLKIKEV